MLERFCNDSPEERVESVLDMILKGGGRVQSVSGEAIARAVGLLDREDKRGAINGAAFAEFDLPMVVSCYHCEMTLTFFSAFIQRGSGRILCRRCAGRGGTR